jgi:hypothetical protein
MVAKAEQADMMNADTLTSGGEKSYEKYGWMVLSASAILGIVAALITTLPPISWFWDPLYESAYPIMGALGTALVGLNVLALVMSLIPYRRGERWAWFTLWMLPLGWVSQFVFLTDVSYLVLALFTTVGLALPYRRFFSRVQEEELP